MLNLPRLPQSLPTYQQAQVWWQAVVEAIEAQEALQDSTITDLASAVAAIAAAQAAADAANIAAAAADAAAAAASSSATTANTAAATANTAATTAQATADATALATSLANSYVSGATISATDAGTDATITISGHTRYYPQSDGSTTSVSVTGGSLTGQAYSTLYYIYYDDASRAGGSVTYHSTTSITTAAQVNDRHLVGSVTTPAALAAATGGTYVLPPGVGSLSFL